MTFPEYDASRPLRWEALPHQKIPKTIHQIWIGPKQRPQMLMDTWKHRHPDWTYILWNEDNLKGMEFRTQRHIDEIPSWNGKADLYRWELLHRFGGIYMDADSECLQPFDDFFLENDSFTCYENEPLRGGLVACGVVGATPGNLLMRLCLDELCQMEKLSGPAWWCVGPAFFTWVITKHLYPIKVYPSWWFLPNHYEGARYVGKDKVYADHKWGTAMHLYGKLA